MSLVLQRAAIDSRRPKPFDHVPGFKAGWWNARTNGSKAWLYAVDGQGVDAVRVEVTEKSSVGSGYEGVVVPADAFVEINLLEVREDLRGHGLGRETIDRLSAAYPGRHLAAISLNADPFWTDLGWKPPYKPTTAGTTHSTLFISGQACD